MFDEIVRAVRRRERARGSPLSEDERYKLAAKTLYEDATGKPYRLYPDEEKRLHETETRMWVKWFADAIREQRETKEA